MIKILIDHRERNIDIIKELEKENIPIKFTNLNYADFVINNIGIERKTKQDFLNSIIKGIERIKAALSKLPIIAITANEPPKK